MHRPFASDSVSAPAPAVMPTHKAVKPKSDPLGARSSARARGFHRVAALPFLRYNRVEERLNFLLHLNDELPSSVSANDVRSIIEELHRHRKDRKAVVPPPSRRSMDIAVHPHVTALVRACEAASESTAIDILRECYRAHYETNARAPTVIGRSLVCAALGDLLLRHRPVTKDISFALALLDAAVADGHVGAMLTVGLCLRDGIGVPADLAAALAWIERAADAGYAPALFELGAMYEDGAGDAVQALDADWGEARGCYGAAAGKGLVEAQLRLGKLLWRAAATAGAAAPGVVHVSEAEIADMRQRSREWLELAATAGNEEALRLLKRA